MEGDSVRDGGRTGASEPLQKLRASVSSRLGTRRHRNAFSLDADKRVAPKPTAPFHVEKKPPLRSLKVKTLFRNHFIFLDSLVALQIRHHFEETMDFLRCNDVQYEAHVEGYTM
ncbi:hypothetical protein SRHO_G00119750 [Serrasalmus rhombeus]